MHVLHFVETERDYNNFGELKYVMLFLFMILFSQTIMQFNEDFNWTQQIEISRLSLFYHLFPFLSPFILLSPTVSRRKQSILRVPYSLATVTFAKTI